MFGTASPTGRRRVHRPSAVPPKSVIANGDAMELTQDLLKDILHYDPESGIFTWLKRKPEYFGSEWTSKVWNSNWAGKRAGSGCVFESGYRIRSIKIKLPGCHPQTMREHRLAWLYMTGKFPKEGLDHINRDGFDNRFVNLRESSQQENCQNRSIEKINTSGISGVCWHKRFRKWQARGSLGNRRIHLGYFEDINDADMAIKNFRKENGYSEGHGRKRSY